MTRDRIILLGIILKFLMCIATAISFGVWQDSISAGVFMLLLTMMLPEGNSKS